MGKWSQTMAGVITANTTAPAIVISLGLYTAGNILL